MFLSIAQPRPFAGTVSQLTGTLAPLETHSGASQEGCVLEPIHPGVELWFLSSGKWSRRVWGAESLPSSVTLREKEGKFPENFWSHGGLESHEGKTRTTCSVRGEMGPPGCPFFPLQPSAAVKARGQGRSSAAAQ